MLADRHTGQSDIAQSSQKCEAAPLSSHSSQSRIFGVAWPMCIARGRGLNVERSISNYGKLRFKMQHIPAAILCSLSGFNEMSGERRARHARRRLKFSKAGGTLHTL